MKYIFLIFMMISCYLSASEVGGVKETNYALSLNTAENESIKSTLFAFNGSFPIYDILALTMSAGKSHTEPKRDDWIDTDQRLLSASIFVRDFSFGELGISYSQNYLKYDYPSSYLTTYYMHDTETIYTTTFYATYFFHDFSFGASQSQYSSDDVGVGKHQNTLNISWYPEDNTRIGISSSGVDDLDDHRYYSIQHQPIFLQKAFEFGATYSQTKIDDYYNQYYGLNILYHFNTKVNLITRNREY